MIALIIPAVITIIGLVLIKIGERLDRRDSGCKVVDLFDDTEKFYHE